MKPRQIIRSKSASKFRLRDENDEGNDEGNELSRSTGHPLEDERKLEDIAQVSRQITILRRLALQQGRRRVNLAASTTSTDSTDSYFSQCEDVVEEAVKSGVPFFILQEVTEDPLVSSESESDVFMKRR